MKCVKSLRLGAFFIFKKEVRKNMKKGNRRLNYEDRQQIEFMTKKGVPVSEIAECIGFHRATVYNELKRCGKPYRADEAQKRLR
jgi:IS30 family transposase